MLSSQGFALPVFAIFADAGVDGTPLVGVPVFEHPASSRQQAAKAIEVM